MKKFVEPRLTTNMGRIGGFERDWSPKAFELLNTFLEEFQQLGKNLKTYSKEIEFLLIEL
jgi:NADH:ubiquinone oxidoreductase subunit D